MALMVIYGNVFRKDLFMRQKFTSEMFLRCRTPIVLKAREFR
jgi:hypothetical protein